MRQDCGICQSSDTTPNITSMIWIWKGKLGLTVSAERLTWV